MQRKMTEGASIKKLQQCALAEMFWFDSARRGVGWGWDFDKFIIVTSVLIKRIEQSERVTMVLTSWLHQ